LLATAPATRCFDGGPIEIVGRGALPSAGRTAFPGVPPIGRGRFLVGWYSSDVQTEPRWLASRFPSSVR
jgi:hypothetical protein